MPYVTKGQKINNKKKPSLELDIGSKEAIRNQKKIDAYEKKYGLIIVDSDTSGSESESYIKHIKKKPIKEKSNNKKIKKDIKLLKNCISNTDVPKSIFKKEIDNLKNKLNEVSNKLFTIKVKKTIKGIKKTKIKK